MTLRNDIVALRSQCLRKVLFTFVFKKVVIFLEKFRLLRKSNIFINKSILKHSKHLEREGRRQKERET